jgi:simple sugar transport system ATP-binding protein
VTRTTHENEHEQRSDAILSAENIKKTFGDVVANDGIDFDIHSGEIHSILGENGAGKTTFMKILFGMYDRDKGDIRYRDRMIEFDSPAEALSNGIGLVHQEFKLIPSFSVLDNVILGYPEESWYTLEKDKYRSEIADLSEQYGLGLEDRLSWQVSDLSEGEKQRVEILKILYRDVDVLLLDEPTSILTPNEVDRLFDVLLRLVNEDDLSIVFITHKLEETLEISDRITVFRDGRVVGTARPDDANQSDLARMMVGKEDITLVERREFASTEHRSRLVVDDLMVENNRGLTAIDDLSFELQSGEILGLVGVEGNGQHELVEALSGLRAINSGRITLEGTDITGISRRESRDQGVILIPDANGLVSDFTISDNSILDDHRDYHENWIRQEDQITSRGEQIVDEFSISPPDATLEARQLSGGNKQKIVAGRKLTSGSRKVIIAFNPTKGLDIDTKSFIHDRLVEERDDGTSVLLVTTDMEEAFAISDRLAALNEGRFEAMYEDVESTTKETVGISIT